MGGDKFATQYEGIQHSGIETNADNGEKRGEIDYGGIVDCAQLGGGQKDPYGNQMREGKINYKSQKGDRSCSSETEIDLAAKCSFSKDV